MKRFMKAFVLVAAAAMALTSCENEVMDSVQENDIYTLTFVADAPEGTRTSVSFDGSIDGSPATFAWSADETFTVVASDGTTTQNTNFALDGSKAQITATFDSNPASGSTYTVVYPAKAWEKENNTTFEKAKVILPTEQTLTAGNYDPNADLMYSKNVTAVPNQATTLQFRRLAAVAQMNISGIETGEIIKSVKFSIGENSKFTGRYFVNLATGELAEEAPYHGVNNVVLSGELEASNDADGRTPVYFTCLPGSYSGAYSLTVTTDKAVYTKTGTIAAEKALNFTASHVTGFKINVVKNEADYSGKYFIVAKGNTNWWGMIYDTTAEYRVATDSGIAEYTSYEDFGFTNNYVWNIAKVDGGYTIENYDNSKFIATVKDSNSAYIGPAENAEDAKVAEVVTITKNEETGAYRINSTTFSARFLEFNEASERFAFYKGTQNGDLYLVPVTGTVKDKLTMTFSTDAINLKVGDDFTAPTPTFDKEGEFEVTYSVENTDGSIASVTDNVVSIDTTAAGSATVTATFAGNDNYYPATASYTVTVTEAGAATEKTVTYTVTSTSAVTVSGDAPTGSSATYKSTYSTKYQLTSGNSMTLTLSGYTGAKITGLTMSMKSNTSKGAGNYSMKVGSETISSIATANFNTESWNGAWSTSFVDVTPEVTATTVGAGETIVITIAATANSLYCQSFTLTYETIEQGGGTETPGEGGGETPDPETAKTYTMTIDASYFNSTSYAANNNEKTSTATASDGTTMEVKWTSYQVMLQSSAMQWQKSAGYIYNSTDLGTITDIAVTSSAGTFTEYIGSSKQPTANGAGGYFQIKVGGVTGKTSKIVITFTK